MKMDATKNEAETTPDNVLIVEDDALLALSIEDVLRTAGVPEVRVCPTLAQAIKTYEVSVPDAIILDVHLADRKDGWAFAEFVACLTPNHPQIIFSTSAPEEIPPNVAGLGTIFEKPYDPAMLVEALRSRSTTGIFSRFRHASKNFGTH
jgi:DNA-binding response OmpR family regulator